MEIQPFTQPTLLDTLAGGATASSKDDVFGKLFDRLLSEASDRRADALDAAQAAPFRPTAASQPALTQPSPFAATLAQGSKPEPRSRADDAPPFAAAERLPTHEASAQDRPFHSDAPAPMGKPAPAKSDDSAKAGGAKADGAKTRTAAKDDAAKDDAGKNDQADPADTSAPDEASAKPGSVPVKGGAGKTKGKGKDGHHAGANESGDGKGGKAEIDANVTVTETTIQAVEGGKLVSIATILQEKARAHIVNADGGERDVRVERTVAVGPDGKPLALSADELAKLMAAAGVTGAQASAPIKDASEAPAIATTGDPTLQAKALDPTLQAALQAALQGATPQGATPQGSTPQGATPQGSIPQGATPQGSIPQGATPQGATPQGAIPQGATPQGVTLQGVTLQGEGAAAGATLVEAAAQAMTRAADALARNAGAKTVAAGADPKATGKAGAEAAGAEAADGGLTLPEGFADLLGAAKQTAAGVDGARAGHGGGEANGGHGQAQAEPRDAASLAQPQTGIQPTTTVAGAFRQAVEGLKDSLGLAGAIDGAAPTAAIQAPTPIAAVDAAAPVDAATAPAATVVDAGKSDAASSIGQILPGDAAKATSAAAPTTTLAATRAQPNGPVGVPDQISVNIQKNVQAGNDHFTINLRPDELGHIEIRLDFGKDGQFQASIAVERPQTLELLQRDSRGLERALQDAGIKADTGSLNFSLREDGNPGFTDNGNRGGSNRRGGRAFGAGGGEVEEAASAGYTVNLGPGRLDVRV